MECIIFKLDNMIFICIYIVGEGEGWSMPTSAPNFEVLRRNGSTLSENSDMTFQLHASFIF